MSKNIVKVVVSGAAGNIGYALIFRIASGQMFGPDVQVELRLLELEYALPAMRGIVMELEDCAFPLLNSVTITSDPKAAFKGADFALLVGSVRPLLTELQRMAGALGVRAEFLANLNLRYREWKEAQHG